MEDDKSDASGKRRRRIASSSCVSSKDDSFINEHFISKKANDDRRSGLELQKQTKIGLHQIELEGVAIGFGDMPQREFKL